MPTPRLAAPALLLVLSVPAAAQTFTVLVKDGDAIGGLGNLTAIDGLSVNSNGSWLVELNTDGPLDFDQVVVRDGSVLLSEGVAVGGGPATVSSFGPGVLGDGGDVVWNLFLDNTGSGSSDSGIFSGADLVLQEGTFSGAAGFSPGTPYIGFFGARANGLGDGLVLASVDDPSIPSTVDRALVAFDVGPGGTLLGETVIVKEGDAPASLGGDSITDFETGPHAWDWNDLGTVLYVADLTGASATNAALMLDTAVVAREGSPSPLAGRNYELLTSRPCSLNASGSILFRANLDGDSASDEVLILDGAVVAQEGDLVAGAFGSFALENFGTSSPVLLSDAGDVCTYVNWADPDTTRDAGILYNGQLLVQEGATLVGGLLVEDLGGGVQETLSMSRDGRFVLFECKLAGGIDAAVLVLLGTIEPYCYGDGSGTPCPCGNAGLAGRGCNNSFATGGALLTLQSGTPASNDVVLAGSGLPPTTTVLPIRSTSANLTGNTFGDGLLCINAPVVRLGAQISSGGAATFALNHGAGPGTFHYQLWYRNSASFCTAAPFNTSNGLSIAWP